MTREDEIAWSLARLNTAFVHFHAIADTYAHGGHWKIASRIATELLAPAVG